MGPTQWWRCFDDEEFVEDTAGGEQEVSLLEEPWLHLTVTACNNNNQKTETKVKEENKEQAITIGIEIT